MRTAQSSYNLDKDIRSETKDCYSGCTEINPTNPKTRGDQLFEQCLQEHGYTDFEYEKTPAGPDYVVRLDDTDYLFEVKEFLPPSAQDMHEYFAWYGEKQSIEPIRDKIARSRRQFKQFKDKPCCLVLYNNGHRYIHLERWWDVAAAMYGQPAWTFSFDPATGRVMEGTTHLTFTEGGKMISPHTGEARNTTFSAVLVIRYLDLDPPGPRALANSSSGPEGKHIPIGVPERRLGIVVHENKDARIPFTRHIFHGPFDERYGLVGDAITRIY